MRQPTKTLHLAVAAALALAVALPANAAVLFTVQRISDTNVTLSGTGLSDLGPNFATEANEGTFRGLIFEGLLGNTFGPAFGSVEPVSGDFGFGSQSGNPGLPTDVIPGWSVDDGAMIASNNPFFENETTPTGSSLLIVMGGTIAFLPVGTSGRVTTKYTPFTGGNPQDGVTIGTWDIVAPPAPVPLPAGVPLLAGALGLVAALSRRRREAA